MADDFADSRPRRGKGRPMSPANAVGREALIKAACDLLEQMPPARVTRAEVARHAGVDPALIRYYFRDRASLLKAVVEQIIAERDGDRPKDDPRSSEERLRDSVQSFLSFMVRHPYFHRLALEELANSDSDEAREIFAQMNVHSVSRHTQVIEQGVARGELRAANPLLVHIAQIGMCEFFVAARPIIEELLGEDADFDALTKEYARLIGDMMVGGLKA